MGEVVQFKNSSIILEECLTFVGSNKGAITLTCKYGPDGKAVWLGIVKFMKNNLEVEKSVINTTFNNVVLDISRFIKNA